MTKSCSSLHTSLDRDGFVVLPSALSPSQLDTLRTAAAHITKLARAGAWPHVRTLPKQFPPWPPMSEEGIWGVQHLLHPDMPGREVFAELYFGDVVISTANELLGITESEAGERLVMELFNLLVTPDKDFELRWHRDDVPFEGVSVEEEVTRLGLVLQIDGNGRPDGRLDGAEREVKYGKRDAFHAQYNIPLYADSSLHVVCGSHLRPRTSAELEILATDPNAASLPEMRIVSLQAGDMIFYDNNIIHRGVYNNDVERLTLHGSVGDGNGGRQRARNVLQHGVGEWVDSCRFERLPERLRRRAEGMRERLVHLGTIVGQVGYTFEDV